MLFKGQLIVVGLGAWALVELALLALFGNRDYEFFFAVAFLGFLAVAALASPYVVRPGWRSRLNYVTIAGALAFLLIIGNKALAMWGSAQ